MTDLNNIHNMTTRAKSNMPIKNIIEKIGSSSRYLIKTPNQPDLKIGTNIEILLNTITEQGLKTKTFSPATIKNKCIIPGSNSNNTFQYQIKYPDNGETNWITLSKKTWRLLDSLDSLDSIDSIDSIDSNYDFIESNEDLIETNYDFIETNDDFVQINQSIRNNIGNNSINHTLNPQTIYINDKYNRDTLLVPNSEKNIILSYKWKCLSDSEKKHWLDKNNNNSNNPNNPNNSNNPNNPNNSNNYNSLFLDTQSHQHITSTPSLTLKNPGYKNSNSSMIRPIN